MALKQLVAITQIERMKTPGKAGDKAKGVAPKPPITETIKAGTIFKAKDADQEDEFLNITKCAVVFDAKDDSTPVSPGAKDADGLDGLRADYKRLIGKAPAKNMTEDTMREKIAEAEEREEITDAYRDAFGEDPAKNMKVETMREKIAAKQAEGDGEDMV